MELLAQEDNEAEAKMDEVVKLTYLIYFSPSKQSTKRSWLKWVEEILNAE